MDTTRSAGISKRKIEFYHQEMKGRETRRNPHGSLQPLVATPLWVQLKTNKSTLVLIIVPPTQSSRRFALLFVTSRGMTSAPITSGIAVIPAKM